MAEIDMTAVTDVADLVNMPSISSASIKGLLPQILWVIIIGLFLFVIIKFMSHRYNVEIFEKVTGGYVIHSGRYHLTYDRKNKLEYLRPMFGTDRLPSFPMEKFQKVKGMPLIGIKRSIMLLKRNNYSYLVLNPPIDDNKYVGETSYHDTLSWVFLEEKRQFLKNFNKDSFITFLLWAAPSMIILCTIAFFGVMIWLQIAYMNVETNKLIEVMDIVKGVSGN